MRPIAQLSKGFRQRVMLAQAILHQPQLLILDEPTIGLDPTQIIEIRRLIRRLAQRSTVLFSSHILPEVEAVCDRVIIIMNGQIKADAHLAELSATADAILVLQQAVDGLEKALKSLAGVRQADRQIERDGGLATAALGAGHRDDRGRFARLGDDGRQRRGGRPLRRLDRGLAAAAL